MNFLEAVRELVEGKCKGIKRPGGIVRRDKHFDIYADSILADDWQLVDPVPQEEEVEVVRWYSPSLNLVFDAESIARAQGDCIPLTGTYRRPVKPKVKRRVSLGYVSKTGYIYEGVPSRAKFYAEWEE